MDTTQTTTHIGLCAGYGGIELGLKRVIPNMRTVALCEIEAFACANLVSKMEAGLMDAAPIWSDLKTFPWAEFRGKVDILTGGYPCQPFSAAGKRAGKDDPRHLWPWIADGIRLLQPRCCFFENVEGHITLGLSTVISDLEEMGYRTTWGIFSASEVGAPHQRKRVFILAYDSSKGLEGMRQCCDTQGRETSIGHLRGRSDVWINQLANTSHSPDTTCGYAEADRLSSEHRTEICSGQSGRADATVWPSRPGQPQHEWEPPRVVGAVPAKLADFCSRDSQSWGDTTQTSGESVGTWGQSEDAMPNCGSSLCGGDQGNESTPRVVGNATQLFSNGGDHYGGISKRSEKVSKPRDPSGEGVGDATFLRTQGQWPKQQAAGTMQSSCAGAISDQGNWQTEPSLGRDADGTADWMDDAELYVTCDNRTDELRLLGNGVVPATAEKAFRTLMQKMHE